MKKNLAVQFTQFWRMFKCIVGDYNDENWSSIGSGITMPMKLAYHIIHSTRYYIGDESDYKLKNGNEYKFSIERVDESNYLTRDEIIELTDKTELDVNVWLKNIDLNKENEKYSWTGTDMFSVVLFIIRHSYFHLGELNTLLNEAVNGKAKDHFANNVY